MMFPRAVKAITWRTSQRRSEHLDYRNNYFRFLAGLHSTGVLDLPGGTQTTSENIGLWHFLLIFFLIIFLSNKFTVHPFLSTQRKFISLIFPAFSSRFWERNCIFVNEAKTHYAHAVWRCYSNTNDPWGENVAWHSLIFKSILQKAFFFCIYRKIIPLKDLTFL